MAKTRRMMQENISLVDIVIELLDARIPLASKNPEIDAIAKNKHRIVLLNKADLASEKATAAWVSYFENLGASAIVVNSISGMGMSEIIAKSKALMQEKLERLRQRGRIYVPVRAMIVGVPNVGKSTFINKFVGSKSTKTGDRPGVTRGKQWIKIKKDFELLDTPGILWPKFEDKSVGLLLAYTGAINDNILNETELAEGFINHMKNLQLSSSLEKRYNITIADASAPHEVLAQIGETRGFKLKAAEIDLSRAAKILMDEFRAGKLGKITLEQPPE